MKWKHIAHNPNYERVDVPALHSIPYAALRASNVSSSRIRRNRILSCEPTPHSFLFDGILHLADFNVSVANTILFDPIRSVEAKVHIRRQPSRRISQWATTVLRLTCAFRYLPSFDVVVAATPPGPKAAGNGDPGTEDKVPPGVTTNAETLLLELGPNGSVTNRNRLFGLSARPALKPPTRVERSPFRRKCRRAKRQHYRGSEQNRLQQPPFV